MRTRMQLSPKVAPSIKLRTTLIYTAAGIAAAAVIGVAVFLYLNFGNTDSAFAVNVTYTTNASGNWTTAATWQGGNVAPTTDINGDNVIIGNNHSVIRSGNITAMNDFNLTIQPSARLTINGDLSVQNNFTLNGGGTLVVTGNLVASNGAVLNISNGSSITVNGDIAFGNNADFTLDGTLIAGGNVTFGNNGTFDGTGNASIMGSGCSVWTGAGTCNNGPGLMPVELLSFTAKDNGSGAVDLFWETASEKNCDYFAIQRSLDGKTFSDLGTVKGNGTTTYKTKYYFTDSNPPVETRLYYRLVQSDYDGRTETFAPVLVSVELKQDNISVYPNPLIGRKLTVIIPDAKAGSVNISDHRGNQVLSREVSEGNSNIEIEFDTDLSPGMYHVTYKSGSTVKNAKLVKK